MKARNFQIIILIALFVAVTSSGEASLMYGPNSSTIVVTGTESKENPNNIGALPQTSPAEAARDSGIESQTQLSALLQVVQGIEDRVSEMRKQADPPMQYDLERLRRDLTLAGEELDKMNITSISPLAELQRSGLQDRLFEMQLSMELLKNRWGGSWNVFGIDFFSSSTSVPRAENAPVPANYKIRVGDTLNIVVMSRLSAQSEYERIVNSNGQVFITGAGNIQAKGKTASQLRDYITRTISSKFSQLHIDVTVEKLATIRVQVMGEVAKPATYTTTGMATVFTALYQAGGPTKTGTFRRISLVRDGEPARSIDLYDFLLKGNKTKDLPLEDGDLIFVPPVGGTISVEGEVVRPGRYEPDFPITLASAIKMSGGVKPGGYLRSVQVERVQNGECKVLVSAPINDQKGKPSFVLEPGDMVTISSVLPDRTNQVVISGPVAAPGIYGLKDKMRVSDLIKLAQGFDPKTEVYGARADILRTDPIEGTEILTFNLNQALKNNNSQNIELQKLDRVFIYQPDQVVFRPRMITVRGAVARPGIYKRTDGMRISDIIAAAGGVLPEAHLSRADLVRKDQDDKTELVRVQLQTALDGDPASNINMQDRDELTVYNQKDTTWQDCTVRVEGAVQRPGVYVRTGNMRVSDLMFACGGLLPEAAKVAEVGHCSEKGTNSIIKVDLASLPAASEQDVLLQDRDVITIPSLNPSRRTPEIVYITGEVARPGPYTLNDRDDKLTDIIARAGGLTQNADKRGMLFLRQKENFENSQQGKDVDIILQRSRAFADKQMLTQFAKLGVGLPGQFIQAVQQSAETLAKPAEVVAEEKLMNSVNTTQSATEKQPVLGSDSSSQITDEVGKLGKGLQKLSDQQTKEESDSASAMGPRVAEAQIVKMTGVDGTQELKELEKSARVSVNLNQAYSDPESPDNITLRDGDRIFIPRITNIVTVVGAVVAPHYFAAGPGRDVNHYIRLSGGFAQDAAKESVVVVRSNGDALPKGQVKTVEPGDMIVVPTTGMIDIAKKWERMGSVTKVISDVLSSAFILTRF